ncbi:MAG: lipopolysaccharide biosynthesis protein [Micromonosporaceae bacterium]|nr:lipopolysaccharide biosynthesis protein [Micromonosporaceae bacterium]
MLSGDYSPSPMQIPARHDQPATRLPERPSYDLADYLGVFRRGWWLLLAGLLIGLAGAVGVTSLQTKAYEASTSVLVLPTGSPDPELSGRRNNRTAINLDTEAQLVGSMATAAVARKLLKSSQPPAELRRAVSVTVPPNTAILEITYEAGSPQAARAGSHAFAEAYLTNRTDSAEAERDRQVSALQTQIKGVQKQLKDVTAKLDARAAQGPDQSSNSYLGAQQQHLSTQLNTLTSRLNELRASAASGGRIISEAQLPESPARPSSLLNLAAGLMLGLLLGVAAALAWRHADRRVARGVDVTRRAGVPLLAELSDRQAAGSASGVDPVFGAFTPAGRLFSRLRNEVVASLESGRPAVVVVTGACRGSAGPTLAANLAVAFTRAGNDVALVYADIPGATEDAGRRLFGAPAAPGLSEVLAGRVALHEALAPAARHHNLRILPAGSTATAAGLLQAETVREALSSLRSRAEYVIVHAPSTAESADAQSLAIHADAVLLAVDLGRATDLDVADAAEQLRRVGTPLLGAVALAPVTPPKRSMWATRSTRAPSPKLKARTAAEARAAEAPTMVLPRISEETDPDADREPDGDSDRDSELAGDPDDETGSESRDHPAPRRSREPVGVGSLVRKAYRRKARRR